MDYKILATDLDGTLNNNQRFVSDGNKAAIQKAVEKGMKVVICSGRSPHSIRNFAEGIGLNQEGCYGIGFNGGIVYKASNMEFLYEHRHKNEVALTIIKAIKNVNPDAPIVVYAESNLIYYEKDSKFIKDYTSHNGILNEPLEDFENDLKKDVLKILVRWEPEYLKEIYNALNGKIAHICNMFFSESRLLEFAPYGSNKSVGLTFLAKHLGVPMEQVAAVGDNYNDYEMVADAGFGVAVANAVDELKQVAKYTTIADNDHDAIKEVIDKIL